MLRIVRKSANLAFPSLKCCKFANLASISLLSNKNQPQKCNKSHLLQQRRQQATALAKEPFANGTTAVYIENMYNLWLQDPTAVHPSWDSFFTSNQYATPPNLAPFQRNMVPLGSVVNTKGIEDQIMVVNIIRAYQARGHFAADLDPLGIQRAEKVIGKDGRTRRADVEVLRQHAEFLVGDKNMDKNFLLPNFTFIGGDAKELTLGEILNRLERAYCGSVGIEYVHINEFEQANWLRKQIETPDARLLTAEEKIRLFQRLERSAGFEAFLSRKYSSEKRFGLEGCDSMIPAMKEIIDRSTEHDVEAINIGVAHRGRLNILSNVCRKPLHQILTQFLALESSDAGSGDVKYHLGTFVERVNRATNKNVRISVVANPSHLEAVNPVVQGKTRAEQFYRCDSEGKRIMSILVHGDAAFCGQGVVFETIHLADLPAYTTHGTIHIVVNNQIGFTVDPKCARSSPYSTDVARVVNAPIFHVNADDPEAVVRVARMAADWRATFHKDVVIDIVGYRRNGHNEADEPMFTQPFMYQRIRQTKPVNQKFAEKLISEGVMTAEKVKEYSENYQKICDEAFELAKKETHIKYKDWLDSPWTGFFEGRDPLLIAPTGVKNETLVHIGNRISEEPPNHEDFDLHKSLQRILKARKAMIDEGVADWAIGEALAFGTLLKEGIHVRLAGQDVERGTFSHRHHVYHHQQAESCTYIPLQHLYPDQAPYTVANSSLSEYGVVGFEHGYSVTNPNCLVLWEAQFGDFSNTAQCIIDQFISSGQAKWVRQSGLVMLLPHGMEGMGPEHSSARLERFLQISNEDPHCFPEENDEFSIRQLHDANWIVANCSTPANYFHILRRQIAMPFRKPLILMSPKSLLRHPLCKSSFDDMIDFTEFLRVISDGGVADKNPGCVEKVVFCSGRVYYDLFQARADRKAEADYAIIRVEQLSPFPYDLVKKQLEKFRDAEIIWTQEEHKNQGAWSYIEPRFRTVLDFMNDKRTLEYTGRSAAAAPATGNKKQHELEFNEMIVSVFGEMTEAQKAELKKMQDEAIAAAKAKTDAEKKAKKEASDKNQTPAAESPTTTKPNNGNNEGEKK